MSTFYIDPAAGLSVTGTESDDAFYMSDANFSGLSAGQFALNGGGGYDTLYLANASGAGTFDFRKFGQMAGIEKIVSDASSSDLYFTPQQVPGITDITGPDLSSYYQARIYLTGNAYPASPSDEPATNALQTFDLRGTHLSGKYVLMPTSPYADIVVSDKSQLFSGSGTHLNLSLESGTRIHLVGSTFTPTEREMLLHAGATYVWDDAGDGAGHVAPSVTGLNGDHVQTQNGDAVYLDAGQDAWVSDDVHVRKISVSLLNAASGEYIDIAKNGLLELPNGIVDGGRIRDAQHFNSAVFANLYNVKDASFDILFNGNLDPQPINGQTLTDYVNKVVHSLIYYDTGSGPSADRTVQISISDGADTTTTSTVTVTHLSTGGTPSAPGGSGTPGSTSAPISGGKGNDKLAGTAANDAIYGGGGNDTLRGLAGNDKLYGGAGKDVLYGSTGKDIFVFDTKPNTKTNLDKIMDFNVKDDTIWLDNKVFAKLGKGSEAHPGKLNAQFFTVGDHAKDKNDYLIYDAKKGVLWYDADGSGNGKAVEIATLKKGLKMTFHDFFVI